MSNDAVRPWRCSADKGEFEAFTKWADGRGHDIAYNVVGNGSYFFFNPATADLWAAWCAGIDARRSDA